MPTELTFEPTATDISPLEWVFNPIAIESSPSAPIDCALSVLPERIRSSGAADEGMLSADTLTPVTVAPSSDDLSGALDLTFCNDWAFSRGAVAAAIRLLT